MLQANSIGVDIYKNRLTQIVADCIEYIYIFEVVVTQNPEIKDIETRNIKLCFCANCFEHGFLWRCLFCTDEKCKNLSQGYKNLPFVSAACVVSHVPCRFNVPMSPYEKQKYDGSSVAIYEASDCYVNPMCQ